MVNEDDHLRIQCRAPGLDLDSCLKRTFAIDDAIEAYLNIAFDEKMGYLTAYPTNLGTGLRATVLLHLPAPRHNATDFQNHQYFSSTWNDYSRFIRRR